MNIDEKLSEVETGDELTKTLLIERVKRLVEDTHSSERPILVTIKNVSGIGERGLNITISKLENGKVVGVKVVKVNDIEVTRPVRICLSEENFI